MKAAPDQETKDALLKEMQDQTLVLRAVWKKHDINPVRGLYGFVQMPIFVGLFFATRNVSVCCVLFLHCWAVCWAGMYANDGVLVVVSSLLYCTSVKAFVYVAGAFFLCRVCFVLVFSSCEGK